MIIRVLFLSKIHRPVDNRNIPINNFLISPRKHVVGTH